VARTSNKPVVQGGHGRPDCFLCSLRQNDPLNVDLFEIGGPFTRTSYSDKRLKRIENRLRRDPRPELKEMTALTVRNHYAYHGVPQPVPNIAHIRHQLESIRDELSERDQLLLRFAGQARVLVPDQVAEAFWSESPEKSRNRQARKQLNRLCLHNLLYRVRRRRGKDKLTAYLLGKGGAALLGDEADWPWIDHPDRVDHRLRHDLGVTQIFLDAHRSRADCQLGGLAARAEVSLLNCWAAPHLDVAVRFQRYVDASKKLHLGGERLAKPDGLFAIGVATEQMSFMAPMLIENETGSQLLGEVAWQIVNYYELAKAESIKKRMPDLDVPNYTVPMLVIADAYRRASSGPTAHLSRIASLRREAVAEFRRRGHNDPTQLPPIFIAYRGDWRDQGIHAPVWDLRRPEQQEDERRSALTEAVRASRPLAEAGRLDANSLLRIDPKAAFWHGKIKEARARSDKQRRAEAAKSQVERQGIDALRERVRAQEATLAAGGDGR
jgi:hypothetical protein